MIDQMLEDNDMLDARTISTDELRQRLDHGHIPHLWNVLTSQYFTGEIIPGSTRIPSTPSTSALPTIRAPSAPQSWRQRWKSR